MNIRNESIKKETSQKLSISLSCHNLNGSDIKNWELLHHRISGKVCFSSQQTDFARIKAPVLKASGDLIFSSLAQNHFI